MIRPAARYFAPGQQFRFKCICDGRSPIASSGGEGHAAAAARMLTGERQTWRSPSAFPSGREATTTVHAHLQFKMPRRQQPMW